MSAARFRRLLLGALFASHAAPAGAGGIELAVFTGPAFATYKQSLTFPSGSPLFQLARLNVREAPSLTAESGLSLGASATLFLSNSFGLEGRVDSVDVDLQSFGGSYTVELGPASSPATTIPVALGEGTTELKRVRPLSINLRFQSQGRVGLGISGGLSYLSKVSLDASPTLTVANLNASIPISLVASPVNSDETRQLGANVGLTLRIEIASGFSLIGEARGFAFRRSELKWEARETGALSVIERALLASIASQIEIPRFSPGFWAARAGLAYRF